MELVSQLVSWLVSYYQSGWYTSYAVKPVLETRLVRTPFHSGHRISDPGIHKSRATGRSDDRILYGGAQYLWVDSVKLALRHPSGAWNFEMTRRLVENLFTTVLTDISVVCVSPSNQISVQ